MPTRWGGPAEPPARPPAPGKGQGPALYRWKPGHFPWKALVPPHLPYWALPDPRILTLAQSPQLGSSPRGAVSMSLGLEAGARSGGRGRPGRGPGGGPPVSDSCLHDPGPGPLSRGASVTRPGPRQEGQGDWTPWHLEASQAWPPGLEVGSLYVHSSSPPALDTTLDPTP